MLHGWREEEWMRTAKLEAAIMNASMNRRKGHWVRPQQCHPFLSRTVRRGGTPLNRGTVRGLWSALMSGRKKKG